MSRVLVLAEPGGTHEGDYAAIVRLLYVAQQAGADCLKMQWVSDVEQMCARRHITPEHPKYRYYRKAYGYLNFPVEWHADFSRLCTETGIKYACTAFLPQDVTTLAPHVEYLKISSFEQDKELAIAASYGHRRVLVSCGARDRVDDVCVMTPHGYRYPFRKFHCVSAYPAPIDELNLALIGTHGLNAYSDHAKDVDVGGWAVMRGAKAIEAHFRLYDCSPENPDYAVAFDPGQFTEYILKIRKAERALGDGVKKIQPSEEWALPYRVTA